MCPAVHCAPSSQQFPPNVRDHSKKIFFLSLRKDSPSGSSHLEIIFDDKTEGFTMRSIFSTTRMAVPLMLALMVAGPTSFAKESTKSKLGLDGYCPVCVVEMKQWMKGSPDHEVVYDRRIYRFPGEKQKEMFQRNPIKYAPALQGDCIVCFAKMKKRMPGSVKHATLRRGRLYLFPAADQRAEFKKHPQQYDNSDLAAGGKCVVCKVEMGHNVPGKTEFTAVHNGLRYLFPGEKQRKMFLANPDKYVSKEAATAKL